ncbi:MAG: homing endonuclease associated repeat-containing protein [Gaiellaceae bacterium]
MTSAVQPARRARRYSDAELLLELRTCAARLGRSPTMREFRADPSARVHAQTLVVRFGSWNGAKRLAGLVPRRFATQEELLARLRELGEELGRTPTGRDLDERRRRVPSKSLLWHTFGSLSNALRAAGFDVPSREERTERALEQGEMLARRLRRLPRLTDWERARRRSPRMLSQWQVVRLFQGGRGGWTTFQRALRRRLEEKGVRLD